MNIEKGLSSIFWADSIVSRNPKTFIGCSVGVGAIVTGVFLLLAALQILPHGVNMMSQLGNSAIIGGVALIGFGIWVIMMGLIIQGIKNFFSKDNPNDLKLNHQPPQQPAVVYPQHPAQQTTLIDPKLLSLNDKNLHKGSETEEVLTGVITNGSTEVHIIDEGDSFQLNFEIE